MNLTSLHPKQAKVLPLLQGKIFVSALDIANVLGLMPRTVRDLCKKWVRDGFLQIADPSRKARMYKLGELYAERLYLGSQPGRGMRGDL